MFRVTGVGIKRKKAAILVYFEYWVYVWMYYQRKNESSLTSSKIVKLDESQPDSA